MTRRYTLFQKVWYAIVVLVVIGLATTGFEIHGSYQLLGYRLATLAHDGLIILLLLLGALYVFWLVVTTREARRSLRDLPSGQRGVDMALAVTLWGVMAVSGALYIGFVLFHEIFAENLDRAIVAYIHTVGAYLVGAFAIWHVYLTFLASAAREPG
jgi:thiosulfate reductase cytochrome b subunit